MNEAMIRNLTKDDIEFNYEGFDLEQSQFAIARLVEIQNDDEYELTISLDEVKGCESTIEELEGDCNQLIEERDDLQEKVDDLEEKLEEALSVV